MATLTRLCKMHEVDRDWLRKVEMAGAHPLIVTLLGADEDAQNCIYSKMSGRAVDFLKAELEKYRKMAFGNARFRRY